MLHQFAKRRALLYDAGYHAVSVQLDAAGYSCLCPMQPAAWRLITSQDSCVCVSALPARLGSVICLIRGSSRLCRSRLTLSCMRAPEPQRLMESEALSDCSLIGTSAGMG